MHNTLRRTLISSLAIAALSVTVMACSTSNGDRTVVAVDEALRSSNPSQSLGTAIRSDAQPCLAIARAEARLQVVVADRATVADLLALLADLRVALGCNAAASASGTSPASGSASTSVGAPSATPASACRADADCARDQMCLIDRSGAGTCVARPTTAASVCRTDAECPRGETCVISRAGEGVCQAQGSAQTQPGSQPSFPSDCLRALQSDIQARTQLQAFRMCVAAQPDLCTEVEHALRYATSVNAQEEMRLLQVMMSSCTGATVVSTAASTIGQPCASDLDCRSTNPREMLYCRGASSTTRGTCVDRNGP